MATPEQIRQFYQNESLKKYSSSGQRQQPLPKLENLPKNGIPKPTRVQNVPPKTPAPTIPTTPVTPEQIRQYSRNESLNKYKTSGQRQSPLPDLGKIPKTPSTRGGGGMASGGSMGGYAKFNNGAVKNATPPISPPASPGNSNTVATVVQGAAKKIIPATVAWAGGTTVGTLGKAAALAIPLVLLDPFSPTETEEDGMLKTLMPSEPAQKIEEEKYPFQGGQSNVNYRVYWNRIREVNSSIFGDGAWEKVVEQSYTDLIGPITGSFATIPNQNTFRFHIIAHGETIVVNQIVSERSLLITERNPDIKITSVARLDNKPDTGGNPPPIIQPVYTTNITNVYNNYPSPNVGNKQSPAPPIIITPISASSSPRVSSTPPPQIIIPELQPDIPVLISPRFAPSETDPDIAQPQQPSYPTVTQTPSTGITPEQAKESKYNNTKTTQSTGVSAPVQAPSPVPETGQKPNVENEERTPTFSTTSQSQTPTNSESSTDELLEIEQAIIRLRISISSLEPQASATSLSNDLQTLERDLTSLRNRASTATPETTATELERIKNRLRGTQQRITNLTPDAQADLANNQRQQIERQIDQEIARVRNPTQTPTQTPAQTQTQTETLLEQMREQLTNVGLGVALLTPLVNPIQQTATNTAPDALRNAAASGVCSTLRPGGCMAGLANNAATAAQTSTANQGLLNRVLNILGGANQALLPFIWQRVQTIDTKLGAQMPGGIGGFLQTAFRATRLDKIINALTLITVLHNAAMLSRNLASTLGEVTSQALAVIGLKDENDSPLDINREIGRQANGLLESVLGAETWTGIKTAWNKANTIISTTTQIVSTVRSLWDSSREVLEWTAENTGKIGNALKKFRVVGENAYRWMPEQVTHQNAWALKIERFRNKTESLDDAASSLQGVLGEVQTIQEEFKELKEQKEKFDKNIADLTPKDRPDNKPVSDNVSASKTVSKAPADAANVFRGEGESSNA